MKRLKVLKLGWEFPPLINGGLGIACLGLSRALAKKVDLTVIVPKSVPDYAFDEFSLTGVNNLSLEEITRVESRYSYSSFAMVERIPVELMPYSQGDGGDGDPEFLQTEHQGTTSRTSRTTRSQLSLFSTEGDLYGGDLASKVVEFSKIAAKLALQKDFDIVHAHDWMTFLAGVEVKRATGKPLVVHIHASQFDRAGADARGWIYDIERYGMENADAVIPVSGYTGDVIAAHYGISPKKIFPVHNGAEPVAAFKGKKKFPEKLVLFLGRLTAQKGPEFFLEIASRVLEQTRNVRFVMAGTGEKLRQLIENGAFHGIGDRFHFTGFLNKQRVEELLSITDIYCMPSVSEPFGLSVLEAVQFKIPSVISKQSGAAEIVRNALKADYWDVHMMAQHIVDLLNDDFLRENLAKNAESDIEASTWESAAQKVISVYKKVLKYSQS